LIVQSASGRLLVSIAVVETHSCGTAGNTGLVAVLDRSVVQSARRCLLAY
jgi:hypothetical protein